MEAKTLADFTGAVQAESGDWDGPRNGRVHLGRDTLRLGVAEEDSVEMRLEDIFDITMGSTPRILEPVPDTPLTIAYDDWGQRAVAVVSAPESTIRKFNTVLFKVVLNGSPMTVKHPARRGGRVTGTSFEDAELRLVGGGVAFETDGQTVEIEPAAVVDFDRESRAVEGSKRPVFVVRHMQDGVAMTTLAATDAARTLSLLGRYLRRHYDRLMTSLQGIQLGTQEVETLVTIYSTDGSTVSLGRVLDTDPGEVKELLRSLHGHGLITPGASGPELTTKGQVVVSHYLERVNH